jgi:DNA-binding MarR family transcriptional regulator
MTDKQTVIAEIIDTQRELQRSLARDRTSPIFDLPLTMSQLKLLLVLHHSGGSGGQELARAMGVGLATLTGIIDRMVSQDLVTRREDPNDRRVRRIELTPHGTQLVDDVITSGTQRYQELLDRIEPAGLDVIHQAMLLLSRAVRESGDGPDAGCAPDPCRVPRPTAAPPARTRPGASRPTANPPGAGAARASALEGTPASAVRAASAR